MLPAVGDASFSIREIVEIIATDLDVPAVSVAPERVGGVGFLGCFWRLDDPDSARNTRYLVGWEPTKPD